MKRLILVSALLASAPALAQQPPSATDIAEAHRACLAWNGTSTGMPAASPGWEHCPKIHEAWLKANSAKSGADAAKEQRDKSKAVFDRLPK